MGGSGITMIVFHGGCFKCTQQKEEGVDFCYDCRYFEADWDKPNLNNRPHNLVEIIREEVKYRRVE